MRPSSATDARWVAGLCRAWEVPLEVERAAQPPRSEAAAREARYDFLRRRARSVGATHVLTAHHADDQAETVLFRVLRGTGIEGLAGIAPLDATGLARPLLPFWREEIRAYARAQRLRWREDPTNRTRGPRRNRIRHELLPWVEREVAPGAARHLVRLATLAREAETEWEQILAPLERSLLRREGGALLLARPSFATYGPALQSRLLRRALRSLGMTPDWAGTRDAIQFITGASSGREIWLSGGVRLAVEFDTVRIERPEAAAPASALPEESLAIARPAGSAEGEGKLRLGGRAYRARWRIAPREAEGEGGWRASFALEGLDFPLTLRAWQPGDRIRLAGGTKSLKKLFVERRVPRSERPRRPLLVDARGRVLWVAGIVGSPAAAPQPDAEALILAIIDD